MTEQAAEQAYIDALREAWPGDDPDPATTFDMRVGYKRDWTAGYRASEARHREVVEAARSYIEVLVWYAGRGGRTTATVEDVSSVHEAGERYRAALASYQQKEKGK